MLLADMNAGMDKNALMAKYDLSAAQFESAMRKLSEPTSLSGRQVPKPADAETRAAKPFQVSGLRRSIIRGTC